MAPKLHRKRCKYCNKPYSTYEETKDYCEDLCQVRDSNRLNKPSREARGIKLLTEDQARKHWKNRTRQCYHCGDLYKVPKKVKVVRTFEKGDHNPYWYCSPECQGTKIANQTHGANECQCIICGERFLGNVSKTCSDECRYTLRKRHQEKETIERRKKSAAKDPTTIKKRKAVSYEELNRRAELERLRYEWSRLTR